MNWQTRLGILLLMVIAVAGLQYRWEPAIQGATNGSATLGKDTPELQITQPVMEHYDETGALAWQVAGTTLQHYEASDRTVIEQPVATIQTDNNPEDATTKTPAAAGDPWHLKARSATMTRKHTQIELNGAASVANADVTIESEQLFVDTTRQFATTDKAVTIHSRGSTAHAAGLEADLTNKTLRLPAQVKEIHEATKRR